MKVRKPSTQFENQNGFNEDVHKALRGNLTFGTTIANDVSQNIKGALVTGTSHATPDTEFAVTHNLNEVPIGFIVFNKNKAGDFYASTTAWTSKQIFLKCTVASVGFTIFIVGS